MAEKPVGAREETTPAPPAPPAPADGGSQARHVARNLLSLSLTQALTWLLSMAVMVYLPAYAGDIGLGHLTLAASYGAFFNLFACVGSSSVIVRDVARDNERDGDYLVAAWLQRVSFCAGLGLLTPVALHFLNYPPEVRTYIYLTVAFAFVITATGALSDALRGREKIPRQSLAAAADKVVSTIAVLLCIYMRWPLWSTILAYGLSNLVFLAVALPEFRRRIPRPSRRHVTLAWQLVLASGPFFATEFFVTVYSQGYPLIIEKFASVAAVGWYGLVLRLFGTALFVPSIITGGIFPTIARLRVTNPEVVPKMAQTLVRLIVIAAIPIASILILTPGEIIKVLHYPDSFRNAVPVFMLFGVGLVLWFLSMPIGMLLTVYDQQKELSKAAGISALVVFPLAATLVHATHTYLQNGAIGAAISHILVEIFMLLCYLRALPSDVLPSRMLLRHTAFVLVSALPMAGVLLLVRWYVSPLATLLAAIPMTAVFLGLCYATRCILPEDLAVVRNAVKNRRGG